MAPLELQVEGPRARRSRVATALAVVLVAGAVFLDSIGNDFVWDDVALIGRNELIREVRNLPRVFTTHYWDLGEGGARATGAYRPVTVASYLLNYPVAGPSPAAFRVVNIVLHALNALLVYLLCVGLGLPAAAALASALVFAVHPVHVEAVVWITGRGELLATLGVLAALLSYLRHRRDGGWGWLGVSVGTLAFGLFAKETAIAFLPLIVLVELALSSAEGASAPALRARLWRCVPFLGAALAYFVVRYAVLGAVEDRGADAGFFFVGATSREIFLTMVQVFASYWRLLFFPLELSASYDQSDFPVPGSLMEPRFVAAVAVHALLLAAIALMWRARKPLAALSLAWVYAALLPYSHLVHFEWLMAERFLYLPSVGVAIGAGIALQWLRSWPRGPSGATATATATLVAVVTLLAVRTVARGRDWATELRFFGILAREKPDLVGARYSYGRALLDAGRFDEALVEYEATVRLRPDLPEARRILESLRLRQRALGRPPVGAAPGPPGSSP